MTLAPIARAHDIADGLFERHGTVFGGELPTYRGHVHRVIGLVGAQTEVPSPVATPLGVAAFFHDSAIWFDATWDYLAPSARRAVAELEERDQQHKELVVALIDEHHRLRHARHPDPLVEAFRRADLTDVSAGFVRSPGVSRPDYRALVAEYPSRGFRPMLMRAFGRGLRQAPLHPMPMMKL